MKIHEYQAKELLKAYGAPVPGGCVVQTPDEAAEAARGLGTCVLKAQVHSGGRGKAGGVRLAYDAGEARGLAQQMLGMQLVTAQTGPEGKTVRKLLVTEAVEVKREMYLSVTGDPEHAGLAIIASADGGTEIETLASEHPEAIAKIAIPITVPDGCGVAAGDGTVAGECAVGGECAEKNNTAQGLHKYAEQTAESLGLEGALKDELEALLESMVRLYMDKDCSLIEINPLVETGDGHLLCLDAKINFDDNALFRHPDVVELRDRDEEDPKELKASEYDLNFVSLKGDIGCLVNGAGLAMATMDIIKSFGGEPANFLDVGGGATAAKVAAAFELLLSDGHINAIFVNIFGGIMKCDVIAEGIVTAAKGMKLEVPLVVRLEGTNVETGRRILAGSGLDITPARDMGDGARLSVELARKHAAEGGHSADEHTH